MEWPTEWREPLIAPIGNLPIGVSKIQTCPSRRSDISEKYLWNPILAPDKVRYTKT
jgi:hypothetical protein